MLERYADIGAIRTAATAAAAEWQGLASALESGAAVDPEAVAQVGSTLLRARINATGIMLCEIGKALEAGVLPEALLEAARIVSFELDRLSRGEIRPSLYMAPIGEELATGGKLVLRPAGAFFLPVIPTLPSATGEESLPEEFAKAADTHRPAYETALIRFARGGDRTDLLAMQTALVAIENRNPSAEYRLVIALASAFMSALEDGVVPLCDEAKHLFSRIDAVLRAASRCAPVPDHCIASRLAYAVVQVPPSHKRSARLQECLGLPDLLDDRPPTIAQFPAMDIFDTAFQAMVEEFERYLAEESDGQPAVKAAEKLGRACGGNADVMAMAEALHGLLAGLVSQRLARSPELVDHLSQFMARMLDAIASHDAGLLAQVAREEVDAADVIWRDGAPAPMTRDGGSQPMADFLREAAADARAALAQLENAGDKLSVDAIAEVSRLLEMVEAVLLMCHLEDGTGVVRDIRHSLNEWQEGHPWNAVLDTLVRYLEALACEPEAAQALLEDMRNKHLQPRQKSASEDIPGDPEIFEIFFEEAQEVVAAIRDAVGEGESPLSDQELATSVRRGFHTLKGSARMAGLVHLGEVMYGAEKVFNTWLTRPLPYPQELSRFADTWSRFAVAVCETIAKSGRCEVDESAMQPECDRLLALAGAAVEPADVPARPAAETIASPPAEGPEATAVEEEFDPDLLALFFTESAELLAKLREQTQAARGGFVSFELIRTAHGLAGMSRTVGLPEIAKVALPIESWASRLCEMRQRPAARDIDVVLAAADEIERCVLSMKEGVRRAPDQTLVAPLRVHEDAALTAEDVVEAKEAMPAEASEKVKAVQEPAAAAPKPAPKADPAEPREEIDPLILREFTEEATDLLQALDDEVSSPSPSLTQINRFLHTFKGGARLCGAMRLGDLLHRLENLTGKTMAPGEEKQLLAEVDKGLDEARMMLSVLLTPEAAEAEVPADGAAQPATEAPAEGLMAHLADEADENVIFRVTSGQISELSAQLYDMRVARDLLSQQLFDARDASESISHPVHRIEEIAAQIQMEAETSMDAGGSSSSGMFDALEFDRFTALHELTRKLQEAVQDILAVSDSLSSSLARADRALVQNQSSAEAFAKRLAGISRGPLDVLEARLKAAVRSAAVTLGKECRVELPPSKVRIERAVLDRVAPALDHLVRNSVAHGVESAEKRRAAGKPEVGTISISARQRGEMAEIIVADDGGGINVDAVRRKIKERGLEKRYPNDENLLDALFDPGFSTAETLTQVAGRGVGLDVVQDIVSHLGGRVRIDNKPGRGAAFILTVPVSASFVSGLMLSVGQGVYLLPGASVVELGLLSGDAVRRALETGAPVELNGKETQLVWLGALVDSGSRPNIQNHNKVVLVDGGRSALLADDVQYMDSLLTKPFPQASAWGGSILGCAVLHDGRTALIIDPARTLAMVPRQELLQGLDDAPEELEPLVMIVDDSITVRKVTSRLLQRHGYRVEMADNGKVALDKLHEMENRLPMAILMDIEMPVMDGFEATHHIKSSPQTAHIPVIIISSRNVEKHIDHAKSMGADHFLGKPFKEDVLIGLLQEYAGLAAAPEPETAVI